MMVCMHKERMSISVGPEVAARVRQCGHHDRGGASGYIERLVRQDAVREGVAAMARWHATRPEQLEQAEAERLAVAEELGESA